MLTISLPPSRSDVPTWSAANLEDPAISLTLSNVDRSRNASAVTGVPEGPFLGSRHTFRPNKNDHAGDGSHSPFNGQHYSEGTYV